MCPGAFNHFISNCRIMHCLKLRNTLHVGHGMTQIRVNADSVTRCMWNIIGNHMDEKMSPFLEYLFSLHLLLLCIVCYTFLRILVIRIWCEIKQWKLYCSGKGWRGNVWQLLMLISDARDFTLDSQYVSHSYMLIYSKWCFSL